MYDLVCFSNLYVRRRLVGILSGTVLPLAGYFDQGCPFSSDLHEMM